MQGRAVAEPEHLNLDVPGIRNEPFEVGRSIAKRACCQALRAGHDLEEIFRLINAPHPDPATAGRGFDQQRIANLGSRGLDAIAVTQSKAPAARQYGDARPLRRRAG